MLKWFLPNTLKRAQSSLNLLSMKLNPLENQKFGRYLVLSRASNDKNKMTRYHCKCECGTENIVYAKHLLSGDSTGCSQCSIKRGVNHALWDGCGEISGGWWYNRVTKSRTGRRKQPIVSIDVVYGWDLFLKQEGKCALSGMPLTFGNTATTNSASLDRIDSDKGYEPGNVQWVHKHVNLMKNVYSQKYFIDICHKISEFTKTPK